VDGSKGSRLLLRVPLWKKTIPNIRRPYGHFCSILIWKNAPDSHAHDLARDWRLILYPDRKMLAAQKNVVMGHSLKAAVAAIMSAHVSNIGSHILARLNLKVFKRILCSVDERGKIDICGYLIREFHDYLHEKSDFWLSFNRPYLHPVQRYLYRDVILPFSGKNFLLDHIARMKNRIRQT